MEIEKDKTKKNIKIIEKAHEILKKKLFVKIIKGSIKK